MQTQVIFQGTTPEALALIISDSVKSQLDDFKKDFQNQSAQDDLLSREQLLKLLQINATTLWHWQNKGRIIVYKFANKCYYKRSEILESLIPLKK